MYCAYTALPTPTVYRRAGEVGNAVPLPYYQTCPPWAGRGPKVRPSGAKRSLGTPPTSPTPKGAPGGAVRILGAEALVVVLVVSNRLLFKLGSQGRADGGGSSTRQVLEIFDRKRGGHFLAESKLKGVALRIWPLNSTANGRNFGANRAKTVPAAGANRQLVGEIARKTPCPGRQKGTSDAVQKPPIKNAASIAYMLHGMIKWQSCCAI